MELTAKVRLGEKVDARTGQRMIWADVVNVGEAPIDRVLLTFEYEYENPQDISQEFDQPAGRSIRIEELGRQIEFLPALGDAGPLPVGYGRAYLLSAHSLATLESIVASLSPERYRLAITMNGHREVAVPGMVVGGFVQRCIPDSFARDLLPREQKNHREKLRRGQRYKIITK